MLPTTWLRNSRSCEMTRMAPAIALQVALKPKQRLQVQMVGRFVQQEQVRFLCQQPRQVGAHDPPAAHLPGRTVRIALSKAQAGEHLLGFGLQTIASQLIEPVTRVVVNLLGMQTPRPDDPPPRP